MLFKKYYSIHAIGGSLKAFGFSISQLTTPMIKNIPASPLLPDISIPNDNREKEVLYASVVFALITSWITLQSIAFFELGIKPWATLFGLLVIIIGSIDVIVQKGK